MLSLEDVQRMTGIEALAVNSRGHIRLSSESSLREKKRALKMAIAFYRKQDKAWRFFLGDMVNDLRLPSSAKKAYCKEAFGEQSGITIYGYSLTAAYWNEDNRDSAAPWSLYKEAAQIVPKELRQSLLQQFVRKEKTLQQSFDVCREWKAVNMPRSSSGTGNEIKTEEKSPSSTLVLSNTNSVELQPIMSALQCVCTLEAVNAVQQALDAIREALCEEETDRFAEK